ncbi:MAG: YeaH/YhbH family protein [Rhodoferax sp.]
MALQIIDRRLAGRNKSIGNRERFLRRYKEQVRDAVRRAINDRGIRDIERAENITIPRKDISEPLFQHGRGGARDTVHPGNTEYLQGDRIPRPQGGGGGAGGSGASDTGQGEDDFSFTLSKEEFLQLFFEDLALPHLLRTQIGDNPEWKSHRAGFTHDGTPNNLSIIRSMRGALGRRIAVGQAPRRTLAERRAQLAALEAEPCLADAAMLVRLEALREEIRQLEARLRRIPYLDPIDLRFRNRVRVPIPSSKAVMFCLMDVSGSMDQARKDLAKRFFILLYLFLTRHYEKIDIVFIRHHTQAQEVDEDGFFHSAETGGTVVSSALVLMQQIIVARYPSAEWNIYGAQASDGDNYSNDSTRCRDLLAQGILPLVRYFAYVQVVEEEQNLWTEYAQLAEAHPNFAIRKATSADQIYPVFRQLFRKQGVAA